MDNFYVYMYLRSKNSKHGEAGTPYYVGKGKKMRAYSKSHRVRPPVDKTMIVFVARDLSETAAHALEIETIAKYGRIDNGTGCLRNRTDGGDGCSGLKHTAGSREKVALGWTPERRAAQSRMMRERVVVISEQYRKDRSQWMKDHPNSGNEMKGCRTPEAIEKAASKRRGRHLSLECRNKLSQTQKGRTVPEERKQQIRATLMGRHPSEETIEKLKMRKNHCEPHSEETKQKLSVALKGIKQPWPHYNRWTGNKESCSPV